MTTFVLLSKVLPAAATRMAGLAEMDRVLEQELAKNLPDVKRTASYALLGPYDFMHIIEAPDTLTAAKVALLINRFGIATTQTLTAIPFEDFRQVAEDVDRVQLA